MMDFKKMAAAFAAGGAILAAGAAYSLNHKKQQNPYVHSGQGQRAFISGSTLSALSAAALLIREYNFRGENIHLLDCDGLFDGDACEAAGAELFVHAQGFDCFWDLLRSIPSQQKKGASLKDDIILSAQELSGSRCRVLMRNGEQIVLPERRLDRAQRRLLNRLMMEEEKQLRGKSVEDWFADDDSFVETDFWRLCASLYRIKESSSVSVLRALLCARSEQMMHLDTMEDWMQLPADPGTALIQPLITYLKGYGVQFHLNSEIMDIQFSDTRVLQARVLHMRSAHHVERIELNADDLCIVTLGERTALAQKGDLHQIEAPRQEPAYPFWNRLAARRQEFAVDAVDPAKAAEGFFTVKMREGVLADALPAHAGLISFPDSNWGISLCVAPRSAQEEGVVIWGSALYPDACGDYVRRRMNECSGKDIVSELAHHLHNEERLDEIIRDLEDAKVMILPYAQGAKISRQPHILDQPDAFTGNLAVLSPYHYRSEPWLEQEVHDARDAVRTLMDQQAGSRDAEGTLLQLGSAVQMLRRY